MGQTTACPLDCYDACRIIIDEFGKIKGDKNHPITQGYLCPHLNHFDTFERLARPYFQGKPISMDTAIEILLQQLKKIEANKVLFYRGSGNLGLMQRSMDHFFAQMGATGTRGSLCDGAGEAGILKGRGVNYPLSPSMIQEAQVVIVWGKNPHTTHSHLLPFLKNKEIIVIDPVETKLAKSCDLHIQIKPHCDLHLALLLSHFSIIKKLHDKEFLKNHAHGYQDFYKLLQSLNIKETLESIEMTFEQIDSILERIREKRTVILVGVGVQKYQNGSEVLHAIDSLAALLGLFGKRGCGVSFLGSSQENLTLPFISNRRTDPIATINFSDYETVFVQGANPLAQLPNSRKVHNEFNNVGFKVYFGLYENETSKACDLVIPAKTFLEKNDVRASYGDFSLQKMSQLRESSIGISEYTLAQRLCETFHLSILDEDECLERLYKQIELVDGMEMKIIHPDIPYNEGFATEDKKFLFIDKAQLKCSSEDGLFLITPKHPRSLNSQFHRENGIFLHPKCGFNEGSKVKVSTKVGTITLIVHYDCALRHDCALIYAGTPEVNVLTPSLLSYAGENAVYQEFKIKVEKP